MPSLFSSSVKKSDTVKHKIKIKKSYKHLALPHSLSSNLYLQPGALWNSFDTECRAITFSPVTFIFSAECKPLF